VYETIATLREEEAMKDKKLNGFETGSKKEILNSVA
jgi:hypothetical protein